MKLKTRRRTRSALGLAVLKAFSSPRKRKSGTEPPSRRRRKSAPRGVLPLRLLVQPAVEPAASKPKSAPPAVPAPQEVRSSVGTLPAAPGFSTHDFIFPPEPLKRSLEGFLLDQRSEHTRRAYGKDLKRFVKFLAFRKAGHGAEPLTRTTLIAYKDFLLSEGLEHSTVDRHLATLRSLFKWLMDDGLISSNPAERVRFMRGRRLSKTNAFTDEEVKRILLLPDLHSRTGALHYAVLMVLFYCGLRRSELCGLRVSQLTEERGHRVFRLRGKGNTERLIVLTPPAWNAIRYYFFITGRSFEEDAYLFTPVRNRRSKTLLKPLDPSAVFYIVQRYARLAGIAKKVSPHSCRATAISNARDHQVSDRAIQEFAGWASPDMITRYDKRRTAIENSAAHAIRYGDDAGRLPAWLTEE